MHKDIHCVPRTMTTAVVQKIASETVLSRLFVEEEKQLYLSPWHVKTDIGY